MPENPDPALRIVERQTALAYLLLACAWGLAAISLWDMALSSILSHRIYTIPFILSSALDESFRELKTGAILLTISFAGFVISPLLIFMSRQERNGMWCFVAACSACLTWIAIPLMFAFDHWLRWWPLTLFQISMTLAPLAFALHPSVTGPWVKWVANDLFFQFLAAIAGAVVGGSIGILIIQIIQGVVRARVHGDTLGPDIIIALLGFVLIPVAIGIGMKLALRIRAARPQSVSSGYDVPNIPRT